MENKKGLSTIVVTLIIILLSLVAVGVVWGVVNNLIKSGSEGVDVSSKCLNINVEATSVICDAGVCDVQLMRTGTGSDAIAGVKLVFRDSVAGTSSTVISKEGNVESLVGANYQDVPTLLTAPDKIEVTPYFLDASGKEQLCTQSSDFEF